ncbi:hypothetical protein GBAR_LOCUS30129, partial [Geodia barretti]
MASCTSGAQIIEIGWGRGGNVDESPPCFCWLWSRAVFSSSSKHPRLLWSRAAGILPHLPPPAPTPPGTSPAPPRQTDRIDWRRGPL